MLNGNQQEFIEKAELVLQYWKSTNDIQSSSHSGLIEGEGWDLPEEIQQDFEDFLHKGLSILRKIK